MNSMRGSSQGSHEDRNRKAVRKLWEMAFDWRCVSERSMMMMMRDVMKKEEEEARSRSRRRRRRRRRKRRGGGGAAAGGGERGIVNRNARRGIMRIGQDSYWLGHPRHFLEGLLQVNYIT